VKYSFKTSGPKEDVQCLKYNFKYQDWYQNTITAALKNLEILFQKEVTSFQKEDIIEKMQKTGMLEISF